jgi:hypothetical protein
MAKHPFIRATEVWVPTRDRRHLDLVTGLYGEMRYFEAVSRGMRFDYDVGLPGKAWAAGHPLMLKDLHGSYFRRGDAAMNEGLSCALALPIFVGGELTSVMVFLCGDDKYHVGAMELWSPDERGSQLGLVDGYFGSAEKFEFASRATSFPRKMGLPGQVWDSGMPVILEDLGRSKSFLRHESAQLVGINRAVGLPCAVRDDSVWVLTFLSALGTPIAQRFECWVPDTRSHTFRFQAGYCEMAGALAPIYEGVALPLDAGPFGEARMSGIPAVIANITRESGPVADSANLAGLTSMVALPVYSGGTFKAILAWYL